MMNHCIRRRIYFDDTDGGGVMYHANYLRYMEHARTDLLRLRGFGSQALIDKCGIVFAVTESFVKYIAPARLSDEVEITASPKEAGAIKIVFDQEIWLLDISQQERVRKLAQGQVTVVCLDAVSFKPVKIPEEVMECVKSER